MITDNTQNGYVAEGTKLKTICESSWIQRSSDAVCMVMKIRLALCIFWSVLIVIGGNTQNGYIIY